MRALSVFALIGVVASSLACAGLAWQEPWRTKETLVKPDQRTRVAYHGRWDLREGVCHAEQPPSLELAREPRHGSVSFAERESRPEGCAGAFPHAAVYYAPNAGYVGSDRFAYYRVNPRNGKRRLVAIQVIVAAQ